MGGSGSHRSSPSRVNTSHAAVRLMMNAVRASEHGEAPVAQNTRAKTVTIDARASRKLSPPPHVVRGTLLGRLQHLRRYGRRADLVIVISTFFISSRADDAPVRQPRSWFMKCDIIQYNKKNHGGVSYAPLPLLQGF
jgi:hypothetical protein